MPGIASFWPATMGKDQGRFLRTKQTIALPWELLFTSVDSLQLEQALNDTLLGIGIPQHTNLKSRHCSETIASDNRTHQDQRRYNLYCTALPANIRTARGTAPHHTRRLLFIARRTRIWAEALLGPSLQVIPHIHSGRETLPSLLYIEHGKALPLLTKAPVLPFL